MASPFDTFQNTMFAHVTSVMGYDASWTPSGGGDTKTAKVLFKEPTKPQGVNEVEYDVFNYLMEYKRGDFDGLIDAVRANTDETVTVSGVDYYVRRVTAKYDGKTYIAILEVID